MEFVKSLVEIAKKNGEIVGARADVRHEEVARLEFPNGDLVVSIYNPFRGEVMRQVMNNLARHCRREALPPLLLIRKKWQLSTNELISFEDRYHTYGSGILRLAGW